MPALLLSAIPVAAPAQPVLIGDMVHLFDSSRPSTRRCDAAIVSRVMAQGTRTHPPLQLVEFTTYTGNTAAKHPTGGWLHTDDAGTSPTSWHTRAECPDGRWACLTRP